MGVPLTLQLDQVVLQLNDQQIKNIILHTLENKPALLQEIMKDARRSSATDQEVKQAMQDVFDEFDEVFKALA